MIYESTIVLGKGGGTQHEFIKAMSPEEARKLHLEYLDDDVLDTKQLIRRSSLRRFGDFSLGFCGACA